MGLFDSLAKMGQASAGASLKAVPGGDLIANLAKNINTDNFLGVFGGAPSTWRERYAKLHTQSMDEIAAWYMTSFPGDGAQLNQFTEMFLWKAPSQGHGWTDRTSELSYNVALAWNNMIGETFYDGHYLTELKIDLSKVQPKPGFSLGGTTSDFFNNPIVRAKPIGSMLGSASYTPDGGKPVPKQAGFDFKNLLGLGIIVGLLVAAYNMIKAAMKKGSRGKRWIVLVALAGSLSACAQSSNNGHKDVNADWNAVGGISAIFNKPNLLLYTKYTDTALMLAPYQRSASAYSGSNAVKYADTANMLLPYQRSFLAYTGSNAVKYIDTASMLANYLRSYLGVKYTDTAAMLANYSRGSSGSYLAKNRSDTMTGSLTTWLSATPVQGYHYFGNTGDKYMGYDGTQFVFSGYPMLLVAPLTVSSGGFSGFRSLYLMRNQLNQTVGGLYQSANSGALLRLGTAAAVLKNYDATATSYDSTGFPMLYNRTTVGSTLSPVQVRGGIVADSLISTSGSTGFWKANGTIDNAVYAPLNGSNSFTGINTFNNATQFNSSVYFGVSPYITTGNLYLTDNTASGGAISLINSVPTKTITASTTASLLYSDLNNNLHHSRYSTSLAAASEASFSHNNTAPRVYVFPNKSDTVAMKSDIVAATGNYIQNTTSKQASSNFNIDGTGTIGTALVVRANGATFPGDPVSIIDSQQTRFRVANNGNVFAGNNITAPGTVYATTFVKTAGVNTNAMISDGTERILVSGAYTPTLTGLTNVSAATLISATYTRIGNVIHFAVNFTVTPTAASSLQLRITMPATQSTYANTGNGSAVVTDIGNSTYYPTVALSNTSSIVLTAYPTAASLQTYSVQFDYLTN